MSKARARPQEVACDMGEVWLPFEANEDLSILPITIPSPSRDAVVHGAPGTPRQAPDNLWQ